MQIEHTTLDLPQAFRSLQAFVRAEVVLIGFDLELYALNELPAVYWYLAKVTNPAQSADYVANNPGALPCSCSKTVRADKSGSCATAYTSFKRSPPPSFGYMHREQARAPKIGQNPDLLALGPSPSRCTPAEYFTRADHFRQTFQVGPG